MCILPNFEASDLKELQKRKNKIKKAEAEKVEMIIPEQQLLENPI
jgi:hypothetical protein